MAWVFGVVTCLQFLLRFSVFNLQGSSHFKLQFQRLLSLTYEKPSLLFF